MKLVDIRRSSKTGIIMMKLFGFHFLTIFGICITQVLNESLSESALAEYNKKFALNFFNELLKDPKIQNKNFVCSPYSIQIAGSLLYAGADGKTASDMVTGFSLPDSNATTVGETFKNSLKKYSNDESPLKIANKIYVKKEFTPAPKFLDIAVKYYDSDVESIEFSMRESAANSINKWVESKTLGKITNLFKPDYFDDDTRLILINAIYFKGIWNSKFNKDLTKLGEFYTTPNEKINVELMRTTTNLKFGMFPELGIRVAEYPFKNTDISMFFLLPDTVEKSLTEVERKLSALVLHENIFNKLNFETKSLFTVPKFKIEQEIDLEKDLRNMGMSSLFDSTANFDNLLSPSRPLVVTKAIHKAFLDVNEEGAEAVAATGFIAEDRADVIEIPFEIKQSFLYFIKGSGNGEIYFMGRFTGK